MNKFPTHLEPFDNGNLVDFREFFRSNIYSSEKYQIHDRVLHHIAHADSFEMANLIINCINKVYRDEMIAKNNGIRMGEVVNKFAGKGTIDRNI